MTDEQRKVVEDNHNLIYSFMRKFNLDRNEYYDLCAIGLCKASISYNKSKGTFSTFAYTCMHNEIKSEWRKDIRPTAIPKDMIIYYEDKLPDEYDEHLEDCLLCSKYRVEDECLTNFLYEDVLSNFSDKEKEAIKMYLSGYSQTEIGDKLNTSRQYINNVIRRLRKKVEYYEKNL